ncbi:hypothetical protein ACI2KS_09705, partial [Pseudomonas sp. NPDC087358]|uniref:hypothetical protein n=1 Tax=Pseudomonas sp. NPDC087358 TaxID=3364439 RepID=UPI00384E8C75
MVAAFDSGRRPWELGLPAICREPAENARHTANQADPVAWFYCRYAPARGASPLLQPELTSKSWTSILTFWVFSMGKYSIQFKITAI